MDKQPKERYKLNKLNKYIQGKQEYTLNGEKGADYVPSLNKINKENNPM